MKTVSNEKIFIDTNILFYANNPTLPFGIQARFRINELAELNNNLIISTQIIKEYASVTLRNVIYNKLDLNKGINDLIENVKQFHIDFEIVHDNEMVLRHWLGLLPLLKSGKDVFDFNIAATLKSNNIHYLFTNNISDFKKFDDWLTIIPLFPEP